MRKLLAWGLLASVALGAVGGRARAVNPADVDRAIERGVELLRRMQGENGKWMHEKIGATALAGLTLLECGATADDRAVQRAADAVRRESIGLTHTYSISLALLFLDRLGDADDVPLLESLTVRLLAGQDSSGGWTYDCPAISQEEVKRLQTKLDERKELRGRRQLPRPEGGKKSLKDLPEEIRNQVAKLERGDVPTPTPAPAQVKMSDNSNTQFAALALWVGRRHGLPVEKAMDRLGARFRRTQLGNGGWSYHPLTIPPEMLAKGLGGGAMSSATMTCAGVLGLALADGATLEQLQERRPDARLPEVGKDAHLNRGLQTLGEVVGSPTNQPLDQTDMRPRRPGERVGGRTFYFLWSLERVAVALDLKTIGKKDWYSWGAEILLSNQQSDGSWHGDYADCGADTCFALLFLKRANLARDLTGQLKGRIKDPGAREIRAGGVGGGSLRGPGTGLKSGIEAGGGKPIRKPLQDRLPADSEGARLADALVKAPGTRQAELIERMEKEKGTQYTEALAAAIPQLEADARRKAREALAGRLTRMKATVLSAYLQDDDAEIRRAVALAIAMKESKELIPNLIPLLRDPETTVVRAAHAALKALTGQDFGPEAGATREECEKAAGAWLQWWQKQK